MDNKEYDYIKREIGKLTGVDLDSYKAQQMQRRLGTYLVRSGHKDWHSLFDAIRHDPEQTGKLKDYLTINVSAFFRDPEKFEHLKNSVLPDLLRKHPNLRIWSAGCSRGHEPYSLAILLAQVTGSYRRHYILATDIDQTTLNWAKTGGPYRADDLVNVAPATLGKYFTQKEDGYHLIDAVRKHITFRYHNLLADPFEERFDLIVCRNVVIYFTPEIKARLYERFYQSLNPGGVLFVGGTEIIPKFGEIGFEGAGINFYRRNGAR
jgi:chemotaxis protein methyltransferase CheR